MSQPTDAVAAEVIAERRRQREVEGFDVAHDDAHRHFELSLAAAAYCFHVCHEGAPSAFWPWHPSWWKPTTPRRDLVKAAALIFAEIERLDRASALAATEGVAHG
jgi:hypothetical protein